MAKQFDVIVVGLGAMGSASVYQLAKAGVRVLGIDQFRPPHGWGSSHGKTRVTRQAVGEGQAYVPLVRRSNEIWKELEQLSGHSLFEACGVLALSPELGKAEHHGQTDFLKKTIDIAKANDIKHEVLEAKEISKRFPQFTLQGNELGYYEAESGYLNPEACIEVQLQQAETHNASLAFDEKVLDIIYKHDCVEVKTTKNSYSTEQLVLTTGPWMGELLNESYKDFFKVYRQVLYWFDIEKEMQSQLEASPVFMWLYGDGAEDYFYGFPSDKGSATLKVSTGKYLNTTTPEDIDRTVSEKEIVDIYTNSVQGRVNGVTSKAVNTNVCMYTVTPDSGFIIDRYPDDDRVLLVSACSGHGFKHSAAIGEVVSQVIGDKITDVDIDVFSLNRFD